MPNPRTSDTNGAGTHGDGGPDLRTVVSLLPTPAVNDMGAGKTPDAWDAWTEAMQARHGNGNGHGKSLEIEAQRLLPTTRATDGTKGGPNQHGSSGDLMLPSAVQDWREYEPAIRRQEKAFGRIAPDPTEVTPQSRKACAVHGDPQEGRPREGVSDLRSSAGAQEIREREAGGPERLSEAASLLPELREHQGGDHAIGSPVPGQAIPEGGVRGVRLNDSAARPSQGPELAERRPGEPDDAVRVVPPEAALAGGQRDSDGIESVGQGCTCKHRLSARFAEFLMGLPAGWVTDVPGLTRAEELKALGNGVVPQQCAATAQAFRADLLTEVAA